MTKTLTALLPGPDKLQILNTRLPVIISLLLIIACAYALSQISWSLLAPDDDLIINQSTTSQTKSVKNETRNQAFRQLTSAHLFGVISTQKSVAATTAPKTKLNLILKGVLSANNNNNNASAIISQGTNGKEDIYSIDDKISSGVVIKEIHPEHVVLDRQGRLETLELIKDKVTDTIISRRPRASQNSGASLQNIRKNILKNPASFSQYATPIIARERGKQIGYRLQPRGNGALLDDIGIEPGDVITSINDIRLDNPQNAISALRKLSSANQIDITVKRNGAEVPLNIQLQ